MLIIWRFMGMAMVTPITARKKTHVSSRGIGSNWSLRRI